MPAIEIVGAALSKVIVLVLAAVEFPAVSETVAATVILPSVRALISADSAAHLPELNTVAVVETTELALSVSVTLTVLPTKSVWTPLTVTVPVTTT